MVVLYRGASVEHSRCASMLVLHRSYCYNYFYNHHLYCFVLWERDKINPLKTSA